MSGFYCLTCCFNVPTGQHFYEHCCGYSDCRVIPIATLCDPPEPTVIDESDLAPGMVATFGSLITDYTFLVSMPLAKLQEGDWLWAEGRTFPFGETFDREAVSIVRRIAGVRP